MRSLRRPRQIFPRLNNLPRYAHSHGLDKVQVFDVEGNTRIIVDNGEVVFENSSIEAIGAHLDIMSLIMRNK